MPAAEDLIAHIAPIVGDTPATNVFKGPMPETPDACVVLTHYSGESGIDRVMGPSLTPPGMEVAYVQLAVRNPVNATGEAKAKAWHNQLDGLGPIESNGRTYHNVEAIDGEPVSLGQDQNARWLFIGNYRVSKDRG